VAGRLIDCDHLDPENIDDSVESREGCDHGTRPAAVS